jgi:hypothetical protein
VHDEVLAQAHGVEAAALDRQQNPRVALDIAHLQPVGHVAADDLVAIEADPDRGGLRAAVGVERHEVGERVGLQQGASFRVHGARLPRRSGGRFMTVARLVRARWSREAEMTAGAGMWARRISRAASRNDRAS